MSCPCSWPSFFWPSGIFDLGETPLHSGPIRSLFLRNVHRCKCGVQCSVWGIFFQPGCGSLSDLVMLLIVE